MIKLPRFDHVEYLLQITIFRLKFVIINGLD